MKYILLLIMTMLSVYSASEEVSDFTKVKEWWKKRPLKRPGFWLAIFLCAWTIVCTWNDDNDAEREKVALNKSVKRAESRLQEANSLIQSQTEQLKKQEQSMFEQSRIIGSISFNTHTSFEGKQRFLNCFRNLARLAKFNVDGTHFEGLICDDGVAIYWFNASTEEMTGFHFFTNSELNRILAGLPDDSHLVGEDGGVQVRENSVLAIAMRESLFRKTPARGISPLEREVSYSCIEDELKLLFRYVYRAQFVKFADLYYKGGGLTGEKDLVFQYYVNPFAEAPHLRTVSDIIVRAGFLDSLYDIHKTDFSQRVIAYFRSMGIEPKLRVKDIMLLNQEVEASHRKACFPFGTQKDGGVK